MDSLLFPVKLGPELLNVSQDFVTSRLGATASAGRRGRLIGLLAVACVLTAGCGYRPVYADGAPGYSVVAGHYSTASFEAVQAAVAGVRSELGSARALGDDFPRVVVEIVRVDERSLGVRATDAGPLARGSEVVVVGRALVLESEGAAPSRDTGDLSRTRQYAAGQSASADARARQSAVRDAARSLGKSLGRALLGLPEPLEG